MDVIKVINISKNFSDKAVLKDISFTMKQGDILGYLGPNASGKTTTINIITGLLQSDSGQVEMLGMDVKTRYKNLYGKVGVLFDDNGLYERLNAKQNLEFYLKACGTNVDYDEIEKMLDMLELNEDANKKVKFYSKGMKRKLAVARLLLEKPKIIFLDEPFDGVDIESRAKIIDIIKEYKIKYGMTIMLTSHVMSDIEELANRIIILKSGEKIIDETMDEFKNRDNQKLEKIYLEVVNRE